MTTRLQVLPSWKAAADFLFVQVGFDLEKLLAWRDTVTFDGVHLIPGVRYRETAALLEKQRLT